MAPVWLKDHLLPYMADERHSRDTWFLVRRKIGGSERSIAG